MDQIIWISNIEIYEFCKLNLETGEKKFYDDYSGFEGFDGFYFKDKNIFFSIFASEMGPQLYYKGNKYQLRKDLHISLRIMDTEENFALKNMIFVLNIVHHHTLDLIFGQMRRM